MSNLIVFDLDGVITSEEAYWDAAGLTLHELLYSPRYWDVENSRLGEGEQDRQDKQYRPAETAEVSRYISRAIFPESEIVALKARAINSNWDVCYAAVCLRLINLLALLPDISALFPLQPWDAGWLAAFRRQISGIISGQAAGMAPKMEEGQVVGRAAGRPQEIYLSLSQGSPTMDEGGGAVVYSYHDSVGSLFDTAIFKGHVGLGLINRFDVYASEVLGYPVNDVFSRYSPLWAFCRDIFQEWYLGDELYSETYGHPPGQRGKPGCVHFERPLLAAEEIGTTLEALNRQEYVLGLRPGVLTRRQPILSCCMGY